jgi:hypothetical protein
MHIPRGAHTLSTSARSSRGHSAPPKTRSDLEAIVIERLNIATTITAAMSDVAVATTTAARTDVATSRN